jgi:flagellar M-ring protein FliF
MADTGQVLNKLKQFWLSRTTNQRVMLGAGGAVMLGMIAFFASLIAAPEYKPLVSGLESADAQTISAELTAKKIPFKLSPDGKSITVPADQLDAARLSVASSDQTHSGRLGYELFDKVSWGQTEFDEKVNYQRALEGELERTIMTIAGIKSARVHLVMPTDSVFLDRERRAKASVTLKLGSDGLSHEETLAIQRLVSGAVDGLKAADVSIIDADSNKSLGVGGDQSGEEGAERELTQRIMATLGPVVGAQNLRASVNVEYDPGTTEISKDSYDPDVTVPLVQQKSVETAGAGGDVGGLAGTSGNVPAPATAAQANVPAPAGDADGAQSSKTENTTYGVNRVVEHTVHPAGRIRRITAALVVDDVVKRKLQPNGKWTETRTKRSAAELHQLELLAANAIGLDTTRGDAMNVQNLAFDRPDDSDVVPPTIFDKARKGASDYAPVLRMAMLLVLFVLAYFLMIRPLQKRVMVASAEAPHQPVLPEPVAAVPMLASSNEPARTLLLKEALAERVKAEPLQSARVIQAWVRGESV